MASSFSSSNSAKKHDVFLSFRGEDTRNNFMSHLRAQLREKGIKTFTDDLQIETGELISQQLIQAIEESRCSMIILSPQYASSTWCLDELLKILDCMKRNRQIVVPIFYHVDRSDVRHQNGDFGKAFAKHQQEQDSRVESWRKALTEVADLPGFVFEDGDEAEFIGKIVGVVSSKFSTTTIVSSNSSDNFFGMNYTRVAVTRLNSYLSTWLADLTFRISIFFFV